MGPLKFYIKRESATILQQSEKQNKGSAFTEWPLQYTNKGKEK